MSRASRRSSGMREADAEQAIDTMAVDGLPLPCADG
jgi:hypothetical protein